LRCALEEDSETLLSLFLFFTSWYEMNGSALACSSAMMPCYRPTATVPTDRGLELLYFILFLLIYFWEFELRVLSICQAGALPLFLL
jgi:hypothetical protein